MLNLYYGRENLDKDQFLFDEIAKALPSCTKRNRKILLLVPDQFTLQAERNAFACLNVAGFMDLDIVSQSRLGFKILEETGGIARTHIDKYGRHMLLTQILRSENENLEAFRGMAGVQSFVEMANNLISEMKQFSKKPEDLPGIIEAAGEQAILQRKLRDIHRIYTKYEETIAGKYIDTEDYLNLFIEKVSEAQLIRNADIWVSGFDYLPPKTMDLLEQLILHAANVNIVMTGTKKAGRDGEIFRLTEGIRYKLREMAEQCQIACLEREIPPKYKIGQGPGADEKEPAIAHIEQELYTYPERVYEGQWTPGAITLCCAANFYAEAESAAAYIAQLIREEGYRYKDILVICNDMEARASVIKRVFADYGIPAFIDKKRGIAHNPVISFIQALIDISARAWRYEDVFRLLKTGFSPISPELCSELENYVIQYRIRGKSWKSDFHYGTEELGEEKLSALNEIRNQVFTYINAFDETFKKSGTVKEKLTGIYEYLKEDAHLQDRIQDLIERLNKEEAYEYAEETAQIWDVVIGIFDQLSELLGEEKMSSAELSQLLSSGFEAVEIGLLPPTIDQVIVGTMQRTRAGNSKALVVIGANDGLLPTGITSEGLLSEDEKAKLLGKGIELCNIDELRAREERLAIYKAFARPQRHLWAAYSAADLEGREMKPSLVFDRLLALFPQAELHKDILNRESPLELLVTPRSSLNHMTKALVKVREGSDLSDEWRMALRWYEENRTAAAYMEPVAEGLFFTNKQHKINRQLIHKLYERRGKGENEQSEITLSPSRLERFARCPFAHFINYGLRPAELRVFEIAGREIGDVYHEVLMKLTAGLTVPGVPITDEASPWMKLTQEGCQARINELVSEEAANYREGVLQQGKEELYRSGRISEVCGQSAWALVRHVQQGVIKKVFFESRFGRNEASDFPPIRVELEKENIYIEGKIDRVDVLDGNYVKIIDYKSGHEKFDGDEARAGYRLQLMLYLRAAAAGEKAEPAGVFYFEIAEPSIDASLLSQKDYAEKLKTEFQKSFKLDGVVLDDPKIIEGIAGSFEGYSDILPIRKTKEGAFSASGGRLLSKDEFEEFRGAVDETIYKLCGELAEGSIDIRPKKTKNDTACKYCRYKSICVFDPAFTGCAYERI